MNGWLDKGTEGGLGVNVEPPGGSTFGRARRRRAYRQLARVVRRIQPKQELLPLEEVDRRLRPFHRRYVGVRSIPLEQIVGSEGRTGDFDREFLPLRHDIETRWRGVERAFPEGGFPPIVVYKLGDAYFVMDGHHRVAIARQRGMDTIDAEITELVASWHLPADADIAKIIYAEQQRIFNEESGLARARPEALIEFSHARGFIELLENVQIHGYHMMRDRNRALEQEEIAGEWYDRIYLPAVEAIRREGFSEACPDCTDADLFLCLYQRRRNLVPERSGCVPLQEFAGEAAAEDRAKAKRGILRSLLRHGSPASGREG